MPAGAAVAPDAPRREADRSLIRVGILGGTFDPPHVAHMRLARAARRELELNRVLFVPAGRPPHKPNREITPVSDRLAMLTLALRHYAHFDIDRSDIDRPPPHYTADLLPLIQRKYPAADLWLVIGGDSLRDFLTWDRPVEIVARCRLAVLPRRGAEVDWSALEAKLPGLRDRVHMLAADPLQVSSTAIRRQLRRGAPVDVLLDPAVADYINRHRLYAGG